MVIQEYVWQKPVLLVPGFLMLEKSITKFWKEAKLIRNVRSFEKLSIRKNL